jgi:cystathionine beta-synthase
MRALECASSRAAGDGTGRPHYDLAVFGRFIGEKPVALASMPSVLDLIGDTPLVEVTRLDCGRCRLFLKLESANPSGSLKDRPARAMVEAAEADGRLKSGGTIVEATAGNTGLGLALVGGRKGYRTLLVVPDKMAREKVLHAQAMGAEVVSTRSDVGKGHPDYYQDVAESIARRTPGAVYINQFANPANPRAHKTTTGPEILRQMEGKIDAVVVGVGSGGMLTGIGRYLRAASPATAMILADPEGSILAPLVETGRKVEPGSWAVEGIGEDFIPPNCDLSLVRQAYAIPDPESFATSRDLLRAEGILAGSSSGTLLAAALRYCRAQDEGQRVVTLVCDSGAKYLSKVFNPTFLAQEGWTHLDRHGTVRDVVTNRVSEGTAIVVRPDDTLRTVFSRMRSSGVSQLPVIDEGGHVVGLVDESDVLAALLTDPGGANKAFALTVKDIMVTRLDTISADAPIADLVPLFRRDHIAIVMDKAEFLGVATRLDLINHFRITP